VLHDTEENKHFFGQLDLDTVRGTLAPTLVPLCLPSRACLIAMSHAVFQRNIEQNPERERP
jgi:hypothetical protein